MAGIKITNRSWLFNIKSFCLLYVTSSSLINNGIYLQATFSLFTHEQRSWTIGGWSDAIQPLLIICCTSQHLFYNYSCLTGFPTLTCIIWSSIDSISNISLLQFNLYLQVIVPRNECNNTRHSTNFKFVESRIYIASFKKVFI